MLPSERLAYSAITNRRRLNLPNDARMVVWVITNVEEWDATQPMPRTVLSPPAGGSPIPDIPNWCWHEYGNRVGFWRLLRVYDEFKIPGVMNINGSALAACKGVLITLVDLGNRWAAVTLGRRVGGSARRGPFFCRNDLGCAPSQPYQGQLGRHASDRHPGDQKPLRKGEKLRSGKVRPECPSHWQSNGSS